MKVYTKGGDKGTTSLIGGARVSKSDVRVEAYGTVDELSAFIALWGDSMGGDASLEEFIHDSRRINSILMSVGAQLAADPATLKKLPRITPEMIASIEARIDELQSRLEPLTNFTIPGGNNTVSLSHVCRTVCRRAERCSIAAQALHPVPDEALIYLNRLSDYFYVAGRAISKTLNVEEILWIP
ncbi:MAG: cob(I)yrinic acid a,c-diamide adenosyltransferase [Rikenellaceae bacterium]